MKEFAFTVGSSVITWLLSHYYYRKKHKSELEKMLLNRIDDLSRKYVTLNEKYTALVDEITKVRAENKVLKNQITRLKKKRIRQ